MTGEKNKIIKPENKPGKKIPGSKIAVVLVRGLIGLKKPVKDTLKMLRLSHKNHCIVLDNTPFNLGMIKKVKDYITWGEVDEAMFKELVEKRGQPYQGPENDPKQKIRYKKFFTYNNKKYKKYFRLNPPRKGFGHKGIKVPFKSGGGLGYREEKIKELLKRML